MFYIKEKDIYEQMIDLALKTNDFEWIKQIHKQRELEMLNKKEEIKWYSKSVALESITNNVAVLETRGIRNIRFDSEYDLSYGTLIQTEKQQYFTGEWINYNIMTDEVRLYLYGYIKGNQEAWQSINSQYLSYQPQVTNNDVVGKNHKKKRSWKFWKRK